MWRGERAARSNKQKQHAATRPRAGDRPSDRPLLHSQFSPPPSPSSTSSCCRSSCPSRAREPLDGGGASGSWPLQRLITAAITGLAQSACGDVIRLVEELVVQGTPARGTFVRQGRAGGRGSTTEERWLVGPWGGRPVGRSARARCTSGRGDTSRTPARGAPAQGTFVRQGLPRVRFSQVFRLRCLNRGF